MGTVNVMNVMVSAEPLHSSTLVGEGGMMILCISEDGPEQFLRYILQATQSLALQQLSSW
jgi:hypothetical protein